MPHVAVQTSLEPILEQKSPFQSGGHLGESSLFSPKVNGWRLALSSHKCHRSLNLSGAHPKMRVKLEFVVFLGNEESEARNHPEARPRTVLRGASSLGGQGEGVREGCSGGAQGCRVGGMRARLGTERTPDDPFIGAGLRKAGRSEEAGGGWGQGKYLAGPFSSAG